MGCVLYDCLGDFVPTSPRYPSPPYFCSLSPSAARITEIEEGDSREHVELSIPDRHSGQLLLRADVQLKAVKDNFQYLTGIQVNCYTAICRDDDSQILFQYLTGIQVNCYW